MRDDQDPQEQADRNAAAQRPAERARDNDRLARQRPPAELAVPAPDISPGIGLAAMGLLLCWIPFVGFLGTLGGLCGLRYLFTSKGDSHFAAVVALLFGLIATGAAGLWTVAITRGSCPHVYSYDGKGWHLDADPLSGALLSGAERTDWDRLESLQPVQGQYRIRVVGELEETDYIDEVFLLLAEHPRGTVVLPTLQGELVSVRDAYPASGATDAAGRDVLPLVAKADGNVFRSRVADLPPGRGPDPRERLTLRFARPPSHHAVLWLTAHNTPFAEEAYVRYMATLGPGMGRLMRLAQTSTTYPYAQRVADESRRLGLPLVVYLGAAGQGGEAPGSGLALGPLSPAVPRDFAVPLTLPPGDEPEVTIRLEMTPLFWEIDQVRLAAAPDAPTAAVVLRPRAVHDAAGRDVRALVAAAEGRRAVLHKNDYIEATFDAPPAAGADSERTVVVAVRGYYEGEFGGRAFLNPYALLAHHLGLRSLPRFALRWAAERSRSGPSEEARTSP
jgi:hypothetical protein